MILLGGTILCVMVEYPNWFADVPSSLERSRSFYAVLHRGYFFQTIGPLTLITGLGFVAAGWRIGQVRNLIVISLVLLIAAELLTFVYIYPRLTVLFYGPETVNQTVGVLKQAAVEFTFADRIRTRLGLLAGMVSIAALLRFFESRYAGSQAGRG